MWANSFDQIVSKLIQSVIQSFAKIIQTADQSVGKIIDTARHPEVWGFVSVFSLFFSEYIFSQWHFAFAFVMIVMADTISGMYIAHRQGQFRPKILRDKLMDKAVAYSVIIFAFSVSTKMMLEDSDLNLIRYLNLPFYSLFITVELRSIVLSWYEFKKWPILGKILDLFDKHEKNKIDDI